jgi:DNA-binding response OmpR family regulator
MASIVLLGLDHDLAEPLTRVLHQLNHQTNAAASLAKIGEQAAQLVFISGDGANYRETVRELLVKRRGTPVIVVNRLPENERWLDALEMGAADYCGAPFEAVQMQWVVDGALRKMQRAAA